MNSETLLPGPFENVLALKSEILKPKDVAALLGRSSSFIYELVDEGKLEAFEPTDRQVKRKTISRRSVLMVLAETGSKNPETLLPWTIILLAWLSQDQLDRVIQEATRLLEKSRSRGNPANRKARKSASY